MVCVRLRELGDRWVDGGNGMCVCVHVRAVVNQKSK